MIASKSVGLPDAAPHNSMLASAMCPNTAPRLRTAGVGLNAYRSSPTLSAAFRTSP